MKSELTFHRPTEGQYVRLCELDNDGAQQMYLPLPENGSEITATEAYTSYITGYQTDGNTTDWADRGTKFTVRLILCEIDEDGDESETDDWGTWNFYADGKGGTISGNKYETEYNQDLIDLAVSYLEAYRVENGEVSIWNDQCRELWDECNREELQGNGAIHNDASTDGWYFADDEALEDLGRRLEANEKDAYSLWCADGGGVQFDLAENEN